MVVNTMKSEKAGRDKWVCLLTDHLAPEEVEVSWGSFRESEVSVEPTGGSECGLGCGE